MLGLRQGDGLGLAPRGKDVSPAAAPVFSSMFRMYASQAGIPQPQRYESLAKVFGQSAWIYAAVMRKAQDEAAIPVMVGRRSGKDFVEVEERHPLRQLLRRVNDFMSWYDLIEMDTIFNELTGNSYWLFFGQAGQPVEVWPIPPHWVRVVPSPDNFVAGYVVRTDGVGEPHPFLPISRSLDGTGILHMKSPNPSSMWYGQGRLQAAWGAALTDEAAVEYRYFFYKNSARPDGLLTTDKPLTDTKVDQLREWWRQTFQGRENAHRMAILDSGMKYQPISVSPKDVDLVNDRNMSRDDILVAFGVSKAVLGIETGDVGRRDEQIKHYYRSTIKPPVVRRASALTEFLAVRFGPDLEIRPDYREVEAFRDDELQRSQVDAAYLDRGVLLINEVRERRGMRPVPWGHEPWSQFSAALGSGAGPSEGS